MNLLGTVNRDVLNRKGLMMIQCGMLTRIQKEVEWASFISEVVSINLKPIDINKFVKDIK